MQSDAQLVAQVKNSFPLFLALVWKHLNLPSPTPIQDSIGDYLQFGPKRSIIEAFRGVGKSWVTSAFVCWALLNDPDESILVVSASRGRSDDFTTFTLRLISEMPILQHLAPKNDQRCSKVAFDVAPAAAKHAPSVKSMGITGQLAGSRAGIIIADDVEVPNNSATQSMRVKLSEAIKEFDAVLKPKGRIIYLGTPQTEESIYNLLPDRGYQIRIWPARYPTNVQQEVYGDRLAPYIMDNIINGAEIGCSTDPKRFSDEDLREREASYGRSGFALQFMLDTRLSDADRYPLKTADLLVMSVDGRMAPARVSWATSPELKHQNIPLLGFEGDHYHRPMWMDSEWLPFTGSVMTIDPSGRGADETSYAVVKHLHGNLYLTEAGGFKGGYVESNLKKLAEIAKRNEVKDIVIESNFGDGMFTQLLRPVLRDIYPCHTDEVRHNTQKEKRIIDVLEPIMNQHRLIVSDKVLIEDYKSVQPYPSDEAKYFTLAYQLTHITRERGALVHDDRLDALAMAVQYWVDAVSKDQNKAASAAREGRMMDVINQFKINQIGVFKKPKKSSWMPER